ncbi:MAG: hypothetical protein M4579_005255 [Chaenotheca gracillima]|nr:MAG: hypothetical protein M4579_005255 [Chaenotheca gracillima]
MATESAAKKLKTSGPLIGTHNGHFHADEALAVHLLRLLPTYSTSPLVRTRDPAVLSTCHTVVDVGGEYDESKNRYDHHQRTFNTTFPTRPTKLSSAGLVYLHFGKAIIAQHMSRSETSPEVNLIWEKLYTEFVEALDGHDNGISAYDSTALANAGVEKRYKDGGNTLSSMVGDLNPNWNDPAPPEDPQLAQAAEDERFLQASELMGTTFMRKLSYCADVWLPARELVQAAFNARTEYDPKGRIMVFPRSIPWKDHLYSLEAEAGIPEDQKVLYVLYPESAREGAKWRIMAVSVANDSFESRKALPEAWRGVRDEKLDEVTGVAGGVFVHASGFIGGNKTWEGAKAMTDKALEM